MKLSAAWNQHRHSAADLYDFIMALFQDPADRRQLRDLEPLKKSVSPEDWQALLSYCAQVSQLRACPQHRGAQFH